MTFLLNEKSVHGQFASSRVFCEAVNTVMQIRQTLKAGGHELLCHEPLKYAQVTPTETMPQAIQSLSPARRSAWTQWVSKAGPYWIDDRSHAENDWLMAEDESDLTNTAIGEAAFCVSNGIERQLVSFSPSNWTEDPINAIWVKTDETQQIISVKNHTSVDSVEISLKELPARFNSWQTLETFSRETCLQLQFSNDAFASLYPHPFHQGAAERLEKRLRVLDAISNGFDENGKRTSNCEQLLAMHFAGAKAWFTDSSPSEKNEFSKELAFPHPHRTDEKLICTWHGKVKSPQLRIHFSWPIVANTNIYVPYVGPKLTKR